MNGKRLILVTTHAQCSDEWFAFFHNSVYGEVLSEHIGAIV